MPRSLTSHACPVNLDQDIQSAHDAYIESCLRTIETMLIEFQSLLIDNPSVQTVSFDQEGDPDCMPWFICIDEAGENVDEDIDEIEEIAERWNAMFHPAAVDFLSTLEGDVLSRANLKKDMGKMCAKIAGKLPLSAADKKIWASSFQSHLDALTLEATTPVAPATRKPPRV